MTAPKPSTSMRAAPRAIDVFLHYLKAEGVSVVFGIPGGAILPAYDPLVDSKVRHILTRHEQGAGHAAEGYAWATGKVGAIGFCSGGRHTLLFAGSSNKVDAAIDCWGGFINRATPDAETSPARPKPPLDMVGQLHCPLFGVFGEEDQNPTVEQGEELRRRARALPDLQAAFAENVGIFDRVWYGLHEVTQEALERFQINLETIKAC